MLWRQSRVCRGPSLSRTVAELHGQQKLVPHLNAERSAWAMSQHADLEGMEQEVDLECRSILRDLEDSLSSMSPDVMLSHPHASESSAWRRDPVVAVAGNLDVSHGPEIDAVLCQSERQYHQYDEDLQKLLLKTLRDRFDNAACMRQLKLSLCKWRLDYQQAYHENRAQLAHTILAAMHTINSVKSWEDSSGCHLFDAVRHLILRVWDTFPVPLEEVQCFQRQICQVLANGNHGSSMLRLFEDELKRHGALQLVDQLGQPDVVEHWLQNLRMDHY